MARPEDTQAVYDRQARSYDAGRSRALFEARWLKEFAAALPSGGRVLDLGCGAGEPIARWFIAGGFAVTGVDFSGPMLAMAQRRWPGGDWRRADMRALDLGETFDGIIAWNSFFHLTEAEQPACIARMARHLVPGGVLMLTVGPHAGPAEGRVGAEKVFHASLSPAQYATCLEDNGLRLTGFLAEDHETQGHTVLMARRS